jgi:hypothetical protein
MQGWFNIHKSINVIRHHKYNQGQKSHDPLNKCRKSFLTKIQHFFTVKILKKIGIEGKYLNII